MAVSRRETVVGIFRDSDRAREAISALKDAGFSSGDVSVLMPNREDTATFAAETDTTVGGAAAGAVTGGILGGLAGWLVGVGALAIPGVGPFIAAGALATTLAGAAIGAGLGAIAGALVDMGVSESDARWYEQEMHGGGTMVVVRAGNRDDVAEDILHRYGAYDVEHREPTAYAARSTHFIEMGSAPRSPMGSSASMTDDMTVDRNPAGVGMGSSGMGSSGMSTGGTDLRGTAVGGSGRGTGSSSMGDTSMRSGVAGTQQSVEPIASEDWPRYSQRFQQDWQRRYGSSGGRWADFEPQYRYGWEMGNRPEYRGRGWADVEPDLRRSWERDHPSSPWEQVKVTVRETWEMVTGEDDTRRSTT